MCISLYAKKANTDKRRDQVPVLGELRFFFHCVRLAGWVIGGGGGAECRCRGGRRWCGGGGAGVLLVTAGRSPDIGIRETLPDNVN